MPEKQLTPETQKAIHAAVDRITAEHGLLAETQEELAAHLEDKTLAYVSGEQPLTETDALLLARHHLGDAKLLGAQLAKAALSRRFIPIPVLERLVIAGTALFLAGGIAKVFYCLVYFPWLVMAPFQRAIQAQDSFYAGRLYEADIAALPTLVIAFSIALFVLARVVPRLNSRRTSMLLFLAALLFGVYAATLPGKYANPTLYFGPAPQFAPSVQELFTTYLVLLIMLPLIMLVEWIRYTCQKAITWRTIALAFSVWFLLLNLMQVIQHVAMKFEEYAMVSRDQSLQQYVVLNTVQMTGAYAGYSAAAQIPMLAFILLMARIVRAKRNRAAEAMPEAL